MKGEKIKINSEQTNIVLIGMSTCGKSTIGKFLAKRLSRKLIDIDDLIVRKEGKSINELFENYGENYFRKIENEVVQEISFEQNSIIATGGGVVLNPLNMKLLSYNGLIIFIDRALENLTIIDDRPLLKDFNELKRLYEERIELYLKYADIIVLNNNEIDEVVDQIVLKINEYFS